MTKGLTPVNLAALRNQYTGTRFCQLIQHHLGRQSEAQRTQSILGTTLMLPETAQRLSVGFIDDWNTRGYDEAFWQRDTASVFDEIIMDARRVLGPLGYAADDEAAFNLFNIVIMSYAYSAYDQPNCQSGDDREHANTSNPFHG